MHSLRIGLLLVVGFVALSATAHAAPDPEDKCQATKLKLAGKYSSCRLSEDSKALLRGTAADYQKCDEKLEESWAKAETGRGASCSVLGDVGSVQDLLTICSDSVVPKTYSVSFALVPIPPVSVVTLQFDVDYSASGGQFVGSGALVSCTNHTGALFATSDVDATKLLTLGFIHVSGSLPSPGALSTCTFLISSLAAPQVADFVVTVTDATDADSNTIAPLPIVVVSSITQL